MRKTSTTLEIAQIAIAVATIIVGGYAILIFSSPLAIPGVKYIMMAPYLSMVLIILINRVKSKFVIIKANVVFAMLMSFINLYMGLAIILSGVLTQALNISLIKDNRWTRGITCSGYAGFVLLTALPISKHLIGGVVFEQITIKWIFVAAGIAFLFGIAGSLFGEFISKRIGNIT